MAASAGNQQRPAQTAIGPLVAALVGAVGAVLVLSVPLPALVVDLLLAANLAAAVVTLVVALVTPQPVKLSSFPSMVVLSSLVRILLCLVVARLIMTTGQAGGLATTVAAVTALNNPIASLGTLTTIAIVQFVVVTAGVGRLAEVAARFALDALPGKQLGLDSALSAQRLSAQEGEYQATRLEAEANFYGAMDGAARFLRGETIATIAIVALTPIVWVLTGGLAGSQWPHLVLVIAGHGLIILLPALLMGAAAAIMVARAGSASPLTTELMGQFLRTPGPLVAAATACLLLALVPGVAKLPLLVVAAGLGLWGWLLIQARTTEVVSEGPRQFDHEAAVTAIAATAPQICLGWGLLDLLGDGGRQLLDPLSRLRRQMSAELGFSVPAFVVRDSEALGLYEYSFAFRGGTVDQGDVWPARHLAVANEASEGPSLGIPVTCPDGRRAAWVTTDQEQETRDRGCEILTAQQVILEHLRWALRKHAAELFDAQRATEILDRLTHTHPATVAEAQSAGLSATVLAAVGQELLKEGLPIADSITLIEALTAGLATTTDITDLTVRVRRAMPWAITELVAPDGTMYTVEMAAEVEEALASGEVGAAEAAILTPEQAAACWRVLENLVGQYRRRDRPIVLLCSPPLRPVLQRVARGLVPHLLVVGPDEVRAETQIHRLHQITNTDLTPVAGGSA